MFFLMEFYQLLDEVSRWNGGREVRKNITKN